MTLMVCLACVEAAAAPAPGVEVRLAPGEYLCVAATRS
jgi:hypothetical protein